MFLVLRICSSPSRPCFSGPTAIVSEMYRTPVNTTCTETPTVYTAADDSLGPSRNIATTPKGHCEVGSNVLINSLKLLICWSLAHVDSSVYSCYHDRQIALTEMGRDSATQVHRAHCYTLYTLQISQIQKIMKWSSMLWTGNSLCNHVVLLRN
jgi:hypothetical protein